MHATHRGYSEDYSEDYSVDYGQWSLPFHYQDVGVGVAVDVCYTLP